MSHVNKILVTTDFSPNGAKAVHYAASLAEKLHASLLVLNVEDERQRKYLNVDEKFNNYTQFSTHHFNQIEAHCLTYKNIKYDLITVKGVVTKTITEFAESEDADLLVLGKSGLDNGFEMEFGSVAMEILSNLVCPLIVVPETYQTLKLSAIMVGLDHLLPEDENDVELINYFIKNFDSQVFLVNVGEKEVHTENYRKLITKTRPFEGETKEEVIQDHGWVISQLMEETHSNNIDLLVIFRRKKSLTTPSFMPRLSNLILKCSDTPILFIPSKQEMDHDQNHVDPI